MRFQTFSISLRPTATPAFPPLSRASSTVNFCGPPRPLAWRFTNARTGRERSGLVRPGTRDCPPDLRRGERAPPTATNVASPSKVFPPSSVTTTRTFIATSPGVHPPFVLLQPSEVSLSHLSEHRAGEGRHGVVMTHLFQCGLHRGKVLGLLKEA